MRQLRLTHPALDFWIEVRVREYDGRWLAVADLAGQPELGVGTTRTAALAGALAPLPINVIDDLLESPPPSRTSSSTGTIARPMVEWFADDDAGYIAWLTANPRGFVLNTTVPPSPSYLVVHRASCRTINRPDDRRAWTREYGKACADTVPRVERWGRIETGGQARRCRLCLG